MTRLDTTPWARAKLTSEQRIELVKAAARLGAERLHLSAQSAGGPFTASLSGGGFASSVDCAFSGTSPYEAATRLLAQKAEV